MAARSITTQILDQIYIALKELGAEGILLREAKTMTPNQLYEPLRSLEQSRCYWAIGVAQSGQNPILDPSGMVLDIATGHIRDGMFQLTRRVMQAISALVGRAVCVSFDC